MLIAPKVSTSVCGGKGDECVCVNGWVGFV